ncbi:ribbon-helix-helix protein, CopG family [Streptomyces sp. NPDC085529]|uniref:ribbon-helix-helix protein, CopG family n=1 Tax=Streptomyces sp. NPDC085529 TaxID=3365729 RepID=UPI0037D73C56
MKKAYSFTLDEEMGEALRDLARMQDRAASSIVRQALRRYLEDCQPAPYQVATDD